MEKKCKICGKVCTNLVVHVRKGHKLDQEQYDNYESETEIVNSEVDSLTEEAIVEENFFKDDVDPIIETIEIPIVESVGITKKQLVDNILSVKQDDPTELLSDFLSHYVLTKKELIDIVNQYKAGIPIPLTQTLKQKMNVYREKVEELVKTNQDTYRITDVNIADILVKNYPYIVSMVDRTNPKQKVWVVKHI